MKRKSTIFSLVVYVVLIIFNFLSKNKGTYLSGAINAFFYIVMILLVTLLIISLSILFYFILEKHIKSNLLRKALSIFAGIITFVLLSLLSDILVGYTPDPIRLFIWIVSPFDKFVNWTEFMGYYADESVATKIMWTIQQLFRRSYGYVSLVVFWFLADSLSKSKPVDKNIIKNSEETQVTAKQFDAKFCPNCGKEIEGKPAFCLHCGYQLSSTKATVINNTIYSTDANSSGFNALSFFFPVIGLILYLVWKDQYPVKSKGIGKWTIIGAITGFVFGIIYYLSVMSLIYSLY
jgi:hypothetical protein